MSGETWVARHGDTVMAVAPSLEVLEVYVEADGIVNATLERVEEDRRKARFWHLGRFHGGWAPTKNGLGEAHGWTFWLLRSARLSIEIGWHPSAAPRSQED